MTSPYDPLPHAPGQRFSPVLFGVLAAVVITFGFQIGSSFLIYPYRDDLGDLIVRLLLVGAYLLLMVWPVWLLAGYWGERSGESLRLRQVPIRFHIAAAVGTLALSQILQSYLLVQELYLVPPDLTDTYQSLNRDSEQFYIRLLIWNDGPGLALSLLAGAFLPAIGEEFLFRGLVQRSFERGLRPAAAIILTAFLFGALHLRPVTFIPLFILGLFLGFIVWRTGSIYPAVLGHLIFNTSAILGLYEPVIDRAGRGAAIHTIDDLVALLPVTAIALVLFMLSIWRINGAGRIVAEAGGEAGGGE